MFSHNNKLRINVFYYPVHYESFVQLVGMAEQGDRSEALRNGWVLSGFSSATTLACLQIFGIVLVSVQLLKKTKLPVACLGSKLLDQLRLDVIQAGCFTVL